jgi:light-regulated signal transduction histidine kinase (bacteriophytochrome)
VSPDFRYFLRWRYSGMVERGRVVPSDQDNKGAAGETDARDMQAILRAEQKRHQEELRQFAYAVSHDLREPVRMIVSYAQLLDRRYHEQLTGEAQEFMSEITNGAMRMDRLLRDLLTYSQQFREAERPLESIDPEGALQGALLTLDPQILESGACITNDPLPSVLFDFAQLNQVFRQLIANAITFRGPEPPKIHISAQDTGDEVLFSIRDNGIGIDPRYHEQIFGVFKKLHGRDVAGTGIGLAISKRIVDQRGGRIWVESAPGKGSTFYFSVPK